VRRVGGGIVYGPGAQLTPPLMRGGLPVDKRTNAPKRGSVGSSKLRSVYWRSSIDSYQRSGPIYLGQGSSPVKKPLMYLCFIASELFFQELSEPSAARFIPKPSKSARNTETVILFTPLVGLYGRDQGTSVVLKSLLARPG
jgi:hypothetical protein